MTRSHLNRTGSRVTPGLRTKSSRARRERTAGTRLPGAARDECPASPGSRRPSAATHSAARRRLSRPTTGRSRARPRRPRGQQQPDLHAAERDPLAPGKSDGMGKPLERSAPKAIGRGYEPDLIATASVALLDVSAEERMLELRQFVVQRKRRVLTRSLTASNSFEVHLTQSDAIPTQLVRQFSLLEQTVSGVGKNAEND